MTPEVNVPPVNRGGRPIGRTAPSSDAVKRVRLALDITQVEMAERLQLTDSALQRLERLGRLPSSKTRRDILKKLARQVKEVYP